MGLGLHGPFDGPMRIPVRLIPNAISQVGLSKLTMEEF